MNALLFPVPVRLLMPNGLKNHVRSAPPVRRLNPRFIWPWAYPALSSIWEASKGNPFIVAVNKNPKAPIFQVADVGIVEDILDFMPELNRSDQRFVNLIITSIKKGRTIVWILPFFVCPAWRANPAWGTQASPRPGGRQSELQGRCW
jgi:hypothetical protein